MTDKSIEINLKTSFISEDEIKEKRRKRQEEWEKVRQPGQSLEAPEEVLDNRTLYDRLKQQKDMKQEEYDEAHKLKNQIRGLDNDEADFLAFVSNRQSEILENIHQEEEEYINDFKKSISEPAKQSLPNVSISFTKQVTKPIVKSQMEMLSGAIKRKRSEDKDISIPEKIEKVTKLENNNISSTKIDRQFEINDQYSAAITNTNTINVTTNGQLPTDPIDIHNSDIEARVVGYLPGIANYSSDENDSADSDNSRSSSDVDDVKTLFPPIVRIKDVQKAINQNNH